MKLQTVSEIRRQYPDEWVLLEIVRDRKDTERVSGRLLGHSRNRDDLDEPHRRFRVRHPTTRVYEFYTGDLVADQDAVIIL
jgi:hypothetical protein